MQRLQPTEARPAGGIVQGHEEAALRETDERIEDIPAHLLGWTADLLRLDQVEGLFEDGQASVESLQGRLQEVVAPGDRPFERALAVREVLGRGAGQRLVCLQALEDDPDGQAPDACRAELDGQRQPVHESADAPDVGHRRRVEREARTDALRTFDEEPLGIGHLSVLAGHDRQGPDGELLLDAKPQGLPAGDDGARHR